MEPVKIMIVEDNTTVAEDARECLEGLDYVVTAVVASGEEAVESADRDRPDAVLMDINLRGDMDGVEAAGRIHAEFDIPVLFLSAYSDRELLQRAKQTGSFGYLVKPFEERELHAMLEMTLYKARAEKERRRMEAKLHQARKMEATNRMAGSIAHHFNNLLCVAIGNLEMAMEDLPPAIGVRGKITEAEKALRKAAGISQLMLTCLGYNLGKAIPLLLSEFCGACAARIGNVLPDGITLETDLPSPGPVVEADPVQFKEVLMALITNAYESMEDKSDGKVVVSVGTIPPSRVPAEHRFPADWTEPEGRCACIAITDTGKGMTGEIVERIFDPFFTDKFMGRGLGLPVVLGIVNAYDGCITVESAPGRGSTFRVILPQSSEPPPHRPSRAMTPLKKRSRKRAPCCWWRRRKCSATCTEPSWNDSDSMC